jgi:hypothetical protein
MIKMLLLGGSKCHGYGIEYTMNKGFDMPWVGYSNTHGILITLPLGFLHTYPCYIEPLPMVFWNPIHGTSNPSPTHGNFIPVPMIYRTPYWSYIESPTNGILTTYPEVFWTLYQWYLNPLPIVFWPPTYSISNTLLTVYWTPYPWYIDPHNHGIFTQFSMVYQTPTHGILKPYSWYIEPPTHGNLTPYPWCIDPLPMVLWHSNP